MKQYLLSMYQPTGGAIPPPEVLGPVMEKLGVIRQELAAQNAWVFGNGLHAPETATVVRPKDGDVLITDGPFVEGKEYLGGVTIIKAPDLDTALAWARGYTEVTGLPIEVRPFQGEKDEGRPRRPRGGPRAPQTSSGCSGPSTGARWRC